MNQAISFTKKELETLIQVIRTVKFNVEDSLETIKNLHAIHEKLVNEALPDDTETPRPAYSGYSNS